MGIIFRYFLVLVIHQIMYSNSNEYSQINENPNWMDDIQKTREYIKSLIDKNLPEDKRFSIDNLSDEELLYFVDFLTWDLDIDETLKYHNEQENKVKKEYDLLTAFTDYYSQERVIKQDVLNELNWLNEDVKLEQELS